ncbi:MAG: hypothetical protein EB121_01465 [Alphaproteobacteria bacterium]|nr:hypothetical protein [Alphaproteobacteria bacterium]
MNIRIVALALALMMGCTTTTTALAQEIPHARDQLTYSFAPLVKQASPAVVNIYAHKIVRQRMVNPFMNDPFFREFFGRSLPPGLSRERAENSLGSGVIVRPEGLVVTNHHVIANADEIKIVMSDRREFSATIEVSDPKTDLAVLRIQETQGQRFQALELRDSDTIEVGDLVLAIGNPFGLQRHGQQGDGHLFTGGQQHVELPLGRLRGDGEGLGHQLIPALQQLGQPQVLELCLKILVH